MLKATYERIIAKPVPSEQKINGIIINIKKPYDIAVVLSIGTNVQIDDLKEGDVVYLHNNSGIEVEHEKEKYWSVHRQSILAYDSK
jgi:co-chaperonin GroES (HSP10)